MRLGFIEIASLITVFQILLLTALLLNRRENAGNSHRYLAAFLFTFALLIYSSFVLATSLSGNRIHRFLAFYAGVTIFFIGPLFYLYIHAVLSDRFAFRKRDWLHFAPFLFLIVYSIIGRLFPFPHAHRIFSLLLNGGICIHLAFYIIASRRFLNHHENIALKSASRKNPNIFWITFLFYGVIGICLFKVAIFFFWYVTRIANFCQFMTTTFFLITFIFINTIVYASLKRTELFTHKNKYNQSALNEPKKRLILTQLRDLMRQEKPHLRPSISLPELAQSIAIPKQHLSQVINESFHLNFNNFINKYRIDEALALFDDKTNDRKTILEIAYEVGFNSKSTFNAAFKKHTGQTPKEFKNGSTK